MEVLGLEFVCESVLMLMCLRLCELTKSNSLDQISQQPDSKEPLFLISEDREEEGRGASDELRQRRRWVVEGSEEQSEFP